MKIKIGLILIALCCCASVLFAESAKDEVKSVSKESTPRLHRFFLDYAIVDHSLKNDNGYSMELIELYEKQPYPAIFIAKFWHQKAMKECLEVNKEIFQTYSKKITLDTTEEEKSKIDSEALDLAHRNLQGYYYDHWDEINKTIEDKLRAAKIKFRKK